MSGSLGLVNRCIVGNTAVDDHVVCPLFALRMKLGLAMHAKWCSLQQSDEESSLPCTSAFYAYTYQRLLRVMRCKT